MRKNINILVFILIVALAIFVLGCQSETGDKPQADPEERLVIAPVAQPDPLTDPDELENILQVAYTPQIQETAYLTYLTEAFVTRVIDGDTIEISTGERVRFIGVDAPEMGFHGGTYEAGATEATEFVRNLIEGQTVWLEADGSDKDRFDRLRRYVWLQLPTDPQDEQQIRRYQLNALLLYHGHAEILVIGSPRNEALFRQLVH